MNSKIYRCGWCGTPTDENGTTLSGDLFKRVVALLEKHGDTHTHPRHGDCCIEEQEEPMRITKDMATDAGDPTLEGQYI